MEKWSMEFFRFISLIQERSGCVGCALNALRMFDEETYQHSLQTAFLAFEIAKRKKMKVYEKFLLVSAALLHDIGKVDSDFIFLKGKRNLGESEREVIRQHARRGIAYVQQLDSDIAKIVAGVHEWQRNNPYPRSGRDRRTKHLPFIVNDRRKSKRRESDALTKNLSRILAFADAFEALVSERSYKKPLSREIAVKRICIDFGEISDIVEILPN